MKTAACGIMYNKEGKILMGLRPNNNKYGGYWEFPGGKLEKNETIQECLKREWIEELNLSIEIDKEVYKYRYANFFCRFFVGKILDEENIKQNVHSEIKYLEKKDICKLKLFEGDINVINSLD
tara:strand:+ start:949 stop:1317 length:369 start_codon:yes stop_codon:yes gene_type:complete